jgi:3D (Asp-Asp-Asp) domain-containing protein
VRQAPALGAALAVAGLLVAGCAPAPAAGSAPGLPAIAVNPAATGTVRVAVTFYAGTDNDPPGSSEIAHPNARHATAGGAGTFADPITLATDPDELPIGTVVYDPRLRKYFVMEDECDDCIKEWEADRHGHLDLWTSATTDAAVLGCEEELTPEDPEAVEINPPADRPVDPHPLYDDGSGRCWPRT